MGGKSGEPDSGRFLRRIPSADHEEVPVCARSIRRKRYLKEGGEPMVPAVQKRKWILARFAKCANILRTFENQNLAAFGIAQLPARSWKRSWKRSRGDMADSMASVWNSSQVNVPYAQYKDSSGIQRRKRLKRFQTLSCVMSTISEPLISGDVKLVRNASTSLKYD